MNFRTVIIIPSVLYIGSAVPSQRGYQSPFFAIQSSEEADSSRESSEEDEYGSVFDTDGEGTAMDLEPLSYFDNPEMGPWYEGDIVYPPDPRHRNTIPGDEFKWKKGIIPFYIDEFHSDAQKKIIRQAWTELRLATCIKSEELDYRPDECVDSILFYKSGSGGCKSDYVGRHGGMQTISLGPKCFQTWGIVAHEILHAIGLYHEHQREDRDTHVRIIQNNIKDGYQGNFQDMRSNALGVDYEYLSIMHYPKDAFAKEKGLITIQVLVPGSVIGQRRMIHDNDALKVDKFYKKECQERDRVHELFF